MQQAKHLRNHPFNNFRQQELMSITITIKKTGPYLLAVEPGEVTLVDHEGNTVEIPAGKKTIALCRCGASSTKPFCDGTHSKIGFLAGEQARKEFDAS
jgi:CDGSH-type Zn-finger protein